MMESYVGKIVSGKEVYIGEDSPNKHIIITGISGSGKSVRIADLERHIIDGGGTIVALDINGTHEKIDQKKYNYISAQKDGLNIRFLDTSLVESGQESMTNLLQYAMGTLCPRQLRGACQLAAVRNALKFAIEHKEDDITEMQAIIYGLEEQDSPAAAGAYNHLCDILEGDIFRRSEKQFKEGMLNVVSLKGINPKTQKRIIEILLAVIWRKMRISGEDRKQWTLVLDEFQNLAMEKDTVLFQMLTEARKYRLRLVLATQTLTIFTKKELAVLNQAAIKLFFQPGSSDTKSVAEFIEPGKKDRWIFELLRLRVGQAITVGALEIAGRPVYQPIITSSDYQAQSNALQLI